MIVVKLWGSHGLTVSHDHECPKTSRAEGPLWGLREIIILCHLPRWCYFDEGGDLTFIFVDLHFQRLATEAVWSWVSACSPAKYCCKINFGYVRNNVSCGVEKGVLGEVPVRSL